MNLRLAQVEHRVLQGTCVRDWNQTERIRRVVYPRNVIETVQLLHFWDGVDAILSFTFEIPVDKLRRNFFKTLGEMCEKPLKPNLNHQKTSTSVNMSIFLFLKTIGRNI